ncbi:hypothetical protein C8J56DRAFT_900195 [Mycena floridula]|nr:hypothetical protein C8J56DRAFT_900195 [Mycena floridula]
MALSEPKSSSTPVTVLNLAVIPWGLERWNSKIFPRIRRGESWCCWSLQSFMADTVSGFWSWSSLESFCSNHDIAISFQPDPTKISDSHYIKKDILRISSSDGRGTTMEMSTIVIWISLSRKAGKDAKRR